MEEEILRHLAGETDDLEARRVERWRARSDENRARYDELRAIWEGTDPGTLSDRTPRPSVGRIVREAERRRVGRRGGSVGRTAGRFRSIGYGLGVAVTAAIVLVLSVDRGAPGTEPRLAPVDVTRSQQTVTMALSDGSVVRLDRGSSVEVAPTAERREVLLSGRAFFAVSPDETPFVVRAGAGNVTVHGTRFEVREDDDGMRVVVVEGRVRVTSTSGDSVDVGAGGVVHLSEGGIARVSGSVDVWTLLEWADGLLLFQDTPLGEVARELTRHFDRPVTVTDPGLSDRRITAWFADERWEDVIGDICLVAGLACSVTEAGATLGR